MTVRPAILPCPFCGSEAGFVHDVRKRDDCQIVCDGCGASGPLEDAGPGLSAHAAHNAAEKWNHRADSSCTSLSELRTLRAERDEARGHAATLLRTAQEDLVLMQETAATVTSLRERAEAAEAQLSRQWEVLKHYANPDNWSDGRWPQDDSDDETTIVHRCIPVTWQQEEGGAVPVADCGDLARSTLSPEEAGRLPASARAQDCGAP